MKCVICKGRGVIIKDQLEVCDNCNGSGEIISRKEDNVHEPHHSRTHNQA